MKKDLICIACPLGCRLTAQWEEETDVMIAGNTCSRGAVYGREEVVSPRRVVTATVSLKSGILKRLPVTTTGPVHKGSIAALLNRLYSLELTPPVKIGEVVLELKEEGIMVVSSRTVKQ